MSRRILVATVFLLLLNCITAAAQTLINDCPYAKNHWNDLACLIPTVTKTGVSQNLSGFNTTLSEIISELPLAAPVSGFTLGLDRNLGVYVPTNENLGSILTERGDTIGKYKFFVGFSFQRFVFQSIDGRSLGNLPLVYFINQNGFQAYGAATASLGVNINQFTAVAAFGLTDRIDVSLTLPFERVSIASGLSQGVQAPPGGGSSSPVAAQSASGSASGPGDLVLNTKATIIKGERFRLAGGTEIRFATGDEYNLLGSGAFGIKPYVVVSRRGRFQPHANIGYQWNSFSVLYQSSGGASLRLPDSLDYSGGADFGVNKRLTLVADLVGQHFFNAPRVTAPELGSQYFSQAGNYPAALNGYSTVTVQKSSFDVDNLGVGFKLNPFGHLLVSANVMIKLNDAGLRANFIPLVGVSYRF